ncbi:hypothetical protein AJ79_05684 [Helicocarpus griseus UAMH5409]|uniref:Guanine nucleotide exchange factor LTE1 n=1 Tax=Helicocarpus griseus UAMH5409 TaxID=1447875 RepID=A0A2B7XL56_9EURO|nr:hypothetical protein AJ79_05684 [Helicocarpus griseus UAMH5409]
MKMESQFLHLGRTPLTPIQSEGKTSGVFATQTVDESQSKRHPNHEKYGFGHPRTFSRDRNIHNKSPPRKGTQRTNSLRKMKYSSEMLKQKYLKRSNTIDITSGGMGNAKPTGREPRNFTVGNVGHNGKMYLRPTNQTRTQPLHLMQTPPKPANNQYLRPEAHREDDARLNRHSMWSNSQLSELRPHIVREDSKESQYNIPTASDDQGSRRHSLDEGASSDTKNRKELRIVIERPETSRPKSAGQSAVPEIEVPIPHFRLGGFRFTPEGNPTLRSSIYTRTTTSDNFRSSTLTKNDPDMAFHPSQLNECPRPPVSCSIEPSVYNGPCALSDLPTSTPAQSSVFYKLKEPIEPSVFEFLAHVMDDPSVVRYVKGSSEISAATPARIVAQISSDSFMDYELVSDFFLTFRSYLSPSNLLSLLLARLQWAINRPEDDGRIIRIRAFAALRHWILNYFVDDFVVNRDLRVQFCERLNQIYENVRSCCNNSASDLKILLDLKRCWNGRCALYWDSPNFLNDTHPDDKVVPGGVAGSRDAGLSRLSGIRPSSQTLEPQTEDVSPHSIAVLPFGPIHQQERDSIHFQSHTRDMSTTSVQDIRPSTDSARSIQAASCSLPSKGQRRGSMHSSRPKGPHPVLVTSSQRATPTSPGPLTTAPIIPVWRRPTHSHKRSGSFSDSVRDDRAPLPALHLEAQRQSLLQTLPHAESIIRGNVYAPVDSSVPSVAPPSPTLEAVQFDFPQPEPVTRAETSPRPTTPAVKGLIGSIRRALHNRQGGSSSSHNTSSSNSNPPQSLRGKTSALPLHVGVGSDTYRERRSGPDSKANPRVDVLCEDALQCYRHFVMQTSQKTEAVSEAVDNEPQKARPRSSTARLDQESIHKNAVCPDRTYSELTTGSKSIVIMDDTRPPVPMMSGALQCASNRLGRFHEAPFHAPKEAIDASSPVSRPDTLVGIPGPSLQHGDSDSISTTRDSGNSQDYVRVPDQQRFSSTNRSRSKTPVPSASSRLRKYASYHSGMIKHRPASSVGSSINSISRPGSREKPLARMLRRRPGGDLRKIQNVHDLETGPRVRSFGSGTSYTESMVESALYMNRDGVSIISHGEGRDNVENIPPMEKYFSTIEDTPSEHVRATFEAAISKFSAIPDDEDGGVESTLLKLEGKWEKPLPRTPQEVKGASNSIDQADSGEDDKRKINRQQHFAEPSILLAPQSGNGQKMSVTTAPYTGSYMGSESSYCSIPLLERGLSDESMKSPTFRPSVSVPQPLFIDNDEPATNNIESSHPSIDVVEETESLKRIPQGSTVPGPATLSSSIREAGGDDGDDDDCSSELSSEISVIEKDEAGEGQYGTGVSGDGNMTFPSLGGLSHPLSHPPSPPMTVQYPGSTSSCVGGVDPVTFQRQPITPDLSPNGKNVPNTTVQRTLDMQHLSNNVLLSSESNGQKQATPMVAPKAQHVPWILAYESGVLAQQFTLVEKAALNEVDWKDLVDMRWSHCSQTTLNWADYLSQHDRRGIDIVVARFNLMVKWAVSEVVLTRNITERAQAITKLIHVAVHSRKLRNYSTMLQITIALCSVDCARLTKTWEIVPDGEKQLLRDMESLVQPIRNFHKLRLEMETTNLQDGCVPFVGLYVQDLTYNSQKPAQIASTREGEPLVNFERYRTAATIVKSLLRLIDASTKYTFEPIYGIIERCLWISALPDEKIVVLSRSLAH